MIRNSRSSHLAISPTFLCSGAGIAVMMNYRFVEILTCSGYLTYLIKEMEIKVSSKLHISDLG